MADATIAEFSTDVQRWEALAQRAPQADGAFFYAVRTTGIYCRPGCSSRLPNQKNVLFFQTCADAEGAGFRPCKRCQPDAVSPRCQQVEAIVNVCKRIEAAEQPLSLKELAAETGFSQYHFHRLFKEVVGVTPKQYAAAQRAKRVRNQLNPEASITQVIYEAGFGASSSFYEGATDMLGMTPTEYKQGAAGIAIRFAIRQCFLGWVLVAATERGICTIEFGDSPDALTSQLQSCFPNAQLDSSDETFTSWVEQVVLLVETPQQGFNLPLDIQGTAFQQRVWQILQTIPAGSTASYAAVAQQLGNAKAVRAVARACASNQLAVAIPCHRVIGSDGNLAGYRWGVDRKQALLTREAEVKVE
ncbi:bifunctional DNA-binding transcriptional regulator/O6-methylguanine-DNA methyltransferase Ada [Phormidium tenue FACHB-886]|nr:bifunctional DNA-binding transcriptional regulator/O6-methylguanine-DNA methyltransferase Ada [Phormidium tenue FACHB-886]